MILVLSLLALFMYFAPGIVAKKRGKKNADAILLLDFLLGWTVLGWIAAMIWAVTED